MNQVNVIKDRETGIANMKKIGITTAEQQKIDEMVQISNALVPLEQEAMKNAAENHTDEALRYVYGNEYNTSVAKISELKSEFLDMLKVRTQENIDKLNRNNFLLEVLIFVIIFGVAVMQVITAVITNKKVLRPIAQDSAGDGKKLHKEICLWVSTWRQILPKLVCWYILSSMNTRSTLQTYIGDISHKLTQIADGNLRILRNNVEIYWRIFAHPDCS
ncbi:MAG: hypothetical protein QM793_10470 [Muricomes sp.]